MHRFLLSTKHFARELHLLFFFKNGSDVTVFCVWQGSKKHVLSSIIGQNYDLYTEGGHKMLCWCALRQVVITHPFSKWDKVEIGVLQILIYCIECDGSNRF